MALISPGQGCCERDQLCGRVCAPLQLPRRPSAKGRACAAMCLGACVRACVCVCMCVRVCVRSRAFACVLEVCSLSFWVRREINVKTDDHVGMHFPSACLEQEKCSVFSWFPPSTPVCASQIQESRQGAPFRDRAQGCVLYCAGDQRAKRPVELDVKANSDSAVSKLLPLALRRSEPATRDKDPPDRCRGNLLLLLNQGKKTAVGPGAVGASLIIFLQGVLRLPVQRARPKQWAKNPPTSRRSAWPRPPRALRFGMPLVRGFQGMGHWDGVFTLTCE